VWFYTTAGGAKNTPGKITGCLSEFKSGGLALKISAGNSAFSASTCVFGLSDLLNNRGH